MSIDNINIWSFLKHRLSDGYNTIVPSLGKFIIEKTYSNIDPVANTFNPPSIKIIFKEELTANDFEFIKNGSKFFKLSNETFSEILNKDVNHLIDFLNKNHEYKIEYFGVFKGSKGFIQFQPGAELLFSKKSFGLQPIKLKTEPVVARKITIEKKMEPIADESAEALRIKALQELKQLLEKPSNKPNKENEKALKGNLFPIVATVLTVVLLVNVLIYLNKETFKPIRETISEMSMGSNIKLNQTEQPQTVIKDNSIKQEIITDDFKTHIIHVSKALAQRNHFGLIDSDAVKPIETESLEVEEKINDLHESEGVSSLPVLSENKLLNKEVNTPKKDIVYMVARAEANEVEKGFYIIAGVFSSIENANKYAKTLKDRGYEQASVLKPKKFKNNLVFVSYVTKREQAEQLHTNFSKEVKEAWIYEAR